MSSPPRKRHGEYARARRFNFEGTRWTAAAAEVAAGAGDSTANFLSASSVVLPTFLLPSYTTREQS